MTASIDSKATKQTFITQGEGTPSAPPSAANSPAASPPVQQRPLEKPQSPDQLKNNIYWAQALNQYKYVNTACSVISSMSEEKRNRLVVLIEQQNSSQMLNATTMLDVAAVTQCLSKKTIPLPPK
jgi:hypothetical protein